LPGGLGVGRARDERGQGVRWTTRPMDEVSLKSYQV
jgi:hypothetical protein